MLHRRRQVHVFLKRLTHTLATQACARVAAPNASVIAKLAPAMEKPAPARFQGTNDSTGSCVACWN